MASKRKPGRPKKVIDPEIVVLNLAKRMKSKSEIAAIMGIDEGTVRGRFSESYTKGREVGKSKLRDKQLSVALAGNPALLIWLGKQYLNQAEKQIVEHDRATIDFNDFVGKPSADSPLMQDPVAVALAAMDVADMMRERNNTLPPNSNGNGNDHE
ncbi:MAG: hypothetical protein HQ581_23750 [Planctomycetes bacterium]|nr:hypothetical protein [Planctomycetota bacterium]